MQTPKELKYKKMSLFEADDKRKKELEKTVGVESSEMGGRDPFGFNNEPGTDFPQLTEMYYYYNNALIFKLQDPYGVMFNTSDKLMKTTVQSKINFNWDKYLDPIAFNGCLKSLVTKGVAAPVEDKFLLFKLSNETIDVQEITYEQSINYFLLPEVWKTFIEITPTEPLPTLSEGKASLPPELKEAFKRKPYGIVQITNWMRTKVKDFSMVGYAGYDVYTLYFTKKVAGNQFVRGKDLLEIISKIVSLNKNKVSLKYIVTKEPVDKVGLHIGGDGYWDVK